MAKNQSLPAHLQEKNSRGEDNLTMHESHEKPTVYANTQAFPTDSANCEDTIRNEP